MIPLFKTNYEKNCTYRIRSDERKGKICIDLHKGTVLQERLTNSVEEILADKQASF